MERRYYSFNEYLKARFNARVQRISLNAGFACPNRDGSLGSRGCVFCSEKGFANFPEYDIALKEQIRMSMDSFRKRFGARKFIAYFQNASNTYAPLDKLRKAYDTIRAFPDIVGLYISTRPDCVDGGKLDLIESYSYDYDVWIEYGIQSVHDRTLKAIDRAHTFAQFREAVEETAKRKIKISAHVILGLPDESINDMTETARVLSRLPLSGIKIHVLHVLKDTKLEDMYKRGDLRLLDEGEFVGIACDFLENTNPGFVIMRLVSNAKDEALVAPKWINEKQRVIGEIEREFEARGTRQGFYYDDKDSRTLSFR
jgi:hypothetical protein